MNIPTAASDPVSTSTSILTAAAAETTRYVPLHTPGHSSNMGNPEEGKSLISNLLLIESSPHRRRGNLNPQV